MKSDIIDWIVVNSWFEYVSYKMVTGTSSRYWRLGSILILSVCMLADYDLIISSIQDKDFMFSQVIKWKVSVESQSFQRAKAIDKDKRSNLITVTRNCNLIGLLKCLAYTCILFIFFKVLWLFCQWRVLSQL